MQLNILIAIVVISATALCVCGQDVPDLPDAFSAKITFKVLGFADPAVLYYDYTKQAYRLDSTHSGTDTIDIWLYGSNPPTHYTISYGECVNETLNDSMPPLSVPLFASYKGTVQWEGQGAQIWEVDWYGNALQYYVGNTTGSRPQPVLLRFLANIPDIWEYEFDFEHVVPGPQPASLFAVSLYDCTEVAPPTTYTVSGYIKDAVTGYYLTGAAVTLTGPSGVTATSSNSFGIYSADQLAAGTYTVVVSANGYVTVNTTISVTSNIAAGSGADISLSPVLASGSIRAVLTWGSYPTDLDTHVDTPWSCTVYYGLKTCSYLSANVTLDIDDTSGYGPETATFSNPTSYGSGSYRYYVYQYSGGGTLTDSYGSVAIYSGSSLYTTVDVPTYGSGRTWDVFTVNAATGAITITNYLSS